MSTSFSDPSGITGPFFGGFVEQVVNPDAFAVAASVTSTTIALSWSAQPDALFYRVYCGLSQDNMRLMFNDLLDLSATISGLTTGKQYFYQVTANRGDRSSSASVIGSAIPEGA